MGLIRRRAPTGGIGCGPADVRAPLCRVSLRLPAAPAKGPPPHCRHSPSLFRGRPRRFGYYSGTGTGRGVGSWYLGTWVGRSMTRGGAVAPGSNPLSPRLLGDSLTGWRLGVCREKRNRQTPGRHPSPLLPRGSHLMDFPVSPDGKWKKLTCEWLRHKSANSPFRGATEWRPGDGRNCAGGVLGASWSGRVRIPDP